MSAFRAIVLVVVGLLFSAQIASASLETDLHGRWYQLLGKADAVAISGLLASNATIELVDLDVTQTKQEFVDSMAEFAVAISNGSVRYKIESAAANTATALVCYHFASNDMLARERFTFARGLVTSSVQSKVADNCAQLPN
jgi:hypothetical protein